MQKNILGAGYATSWNKAGEQYEKKEWQGGAKEESSPDMMLDKGYWWRDLMTTLEAIGDIVAETKLPKKVA